MCGRFYLDEDMNQEIKKILSGMEKRRMHGYQIPRGEVYPSSPVAAFLMEEGKREVQLLRWGFPSPYGSGLLINARSETAQEKVMFREDIRQRRCLIIANGFYEWDRKQKEKIKYYFTNEDGSPVYMAGIYHLCEDGQHTAILTTAANASMEPVHHRMPVILTKQELDGWLTDEEAAMELLHKLPMQLHRQKADPPPEFEQLKLPL